MVHNQATPIGRAARVMKLLLLPLLVGGLTAGVLLFTFEIEGKLPIIGVYGGILVTALIYCRQDGLDCGLRSPLYKTWFIAALALIVGRTVIWGSILPTTYQIPKSFWRVILYFSLVGISEEVYFHGVGYAVFSSIVDNKYKAFLLTPLPFMALHFLGNPNVLWLPLWYSNALAYLSLLAWSRSIYPGIVAHTLIDVITSSVVMAPSDVADITALKYMVAVVSFNTIFVMLLIRKSLKASRE